MNIRPPKNILTLFSLAIFLVGSLLCESYAVDQVSSSELAKAISERITKVEEFRFIKDEAQKLGIRAYFSVGRRQALGIM